MPIRAQVEAAQFGLAAKAIAAGKPSHIVLFAEPSERTASVLHKSVKGLGARTFAAAEGVIGLGGKGKGKSAARAFPKLGVAVATLDEDDVRRLSKSSDVLAVVPNEVRHILGWSTTRAKGAIGSKSVVGERAARAPMFTRGPGVLGGTVNPIFPTGGTVGPVFPRGGVVGPTFPMAASTREIVAYLTGQRDMLEGIIARLGGQAARLPAEAQARPSLGEATWGLSAIGVTGVPGQMGGRGVKVGILDTGLDMKHPDWEDSPVASDATRSRSFVGKSGGSAQDGNGHGTHTAGTLAGPMQSVGNIRYGVAPDCELYVGKVLDDSGSGFDSDIIAGIQWAITSGCRIISMSLGSIRAVNGAAAQQYELIARRLLDREDGALILAAAGNESQRSIGVIGPVGNPAACDSIVAIAAIDSNMRIADFSCGQVDNIGVVDFAGPGVDVYSSVPVSQGRFDEFSGTSMATPHASGVAACLLQAEPTLTPRQLWDRLKGAARPLNLAVTDVGRGLVHV